MSDNERIVLKNGVVLPSRNEVHAMYEARLEGWMSNGQEIFIRDNYRFSITQTDDTDYEIRFRTSRKKPKFITPEQLVELASKLDANGQDLPHKHGSVERPKVFHEYKFFCKDKYIQMFIFDLDNANPVKIMSGPRLSIGQVVDIADTIIPFVCNGEIKS